MSAAALLHVVLVVAQGELSPATPAVMAMDLRVQVDLLARAIIEDGNQPRALGVDEHHHRRRRLTLGRSEGTQERPISHDDRVLQGSAQRDHLAEAEGRADEERHAVGVGVVHLADQRFSLALDPVESIGPALTGARLASAVELALEEEPRALALVLVGPSGIEIDAHHRPGGRLQLGQSDDLLG